ncbi:MAG: NAD-dependent epimerase/dehydratase family protein [Betaproteobacteria bacterium]|nr:NAD-dependent epimerase/dehydratase family protein [Betaproteobacteria bacterium]
MQNTSLVTGANGHLGNNLVRALLAKGDSPVAGIRNPANDIALASLGCSIARIDLLDKPSLVRAMKDVDVVYQVGAVFKHWARNPEQEIYQANLQGTRNALEAAAETGVRRVVYVSSLGALDRSRTPITEKAWNPVRTNIYFRSKTDSEKLAWELADKLGLEMVAVLPGAMIGGNCFGVTPTMSIFRTILEGKLSANPGFFFNFVDVADVAEACWLAAAKGRPGERYLLANENCTGIEEIVGIAQREFPERKIKLPPTPPRILLRLIVFLMEGISKIRGVAPELQSNYLTEFSVREVCDITKARRELGFAPKPPHEVIANTLRYVATMPA